MREGRGLFTLFLRSELSGEDGCAFMSASSRCEQLCPVPIPGHCEESVPVLPGVAGRQPSADVERKGYYSVL